MLAQSVVCQSTMKAVVLCARTVATLSVCKGKVGRVVSEQKQIYRLLTEGGEVLAQVSGKMRVMPTAFCLGHAL